MRYLTKNQQLAYASIIAGLEVVWEDSYPRKIVDRGGKKYSIPWNPFECHADAFELMVLSGIKNESRPAGAGMTDQERKDALMIMCVFVVRKAAAKGTKIINELEMKAKFPDIFPD